MDEIIKVFGDKARHIKDGDEYVAVTTSVEGRKVVELWPKDWCPECDMRGDHRSGCLKVE